jgi:hypothetical protein
MRIKLVLIGISRVARAVYMLSLSILLVDISRLQITFRPIKITQSTYFHLRTLSVQHSLLAGGPPFLFRPSAFFRCFSPPPFFGSLTLQTPAGMPCFIKYFSQATCRKTTQWIPVAKSLTTKNLPHIFHVRTNQNWALQMRKK